MYSNITNYPVNNSFQLCIETYIITYVAFLTDMHSMFIDTTQTQSKYGKYQVKKRKPVEPNLDTLRPPSVVVGRQDEWIEGSPQMLTFWEKLRLEPYSTKKNIVYFALCPDSDSLESMAINFFKDLSAAYEICLLGTHHPGVAGDRKRGVVSVPLLGIRGTWCDPVFKCISTHIPCYSYRKN
jgi:hypothetical protein